MTTPERVPTDSELLDHLDSKRQYVTELDSGGNEEAVACVWQIECLAMDVRTALRAELAASLRQHKETTDVPF